jgi:spore maturation protein CgeB
MRIAYFAHSWLSDWNHGNAHFLRGLAGELGRRGHEVRLYEPMPTARGGWSLAHLLEESTGAAAVAAMRAAYPELAVVLFGAGATAARLPGPPLEAVEDWAGELREAAVVIVHEWMEPGLMPWLLALKRRFGFRLLLHDTHHRAASNGEWLAGLPVEAVDGVIAFGESLRRIYERRGARASLTLHEAADLRRFRPRAAVAPGADVVWIGNWGDEERTRELEAFLLEPLARIQASCRIYGVRYPAAAQARLRAQGIAYGGYLANLEAPSAYAAARCTVHVPRQPYAQALPGIPTIRVFEALACGQALLSAPWSDSEHLFTAGDDYWPAGDGREMAALMMQLLSSPRQRTELAAHAVATVAERHSCAHRAAEVESFLRTTWDLV